MPVTTTGFALNIVFDLKIDMFGCVLGCTLTDEEAWNKLSSYVEEGINDIDNNNNDNNNNIFHEAAHVASERHSASRHPTTLLGKRHSAENKSSATATLSKRHCVKLKEQHSASDQLIVETTLLGERHSASCRGVSVRGAIPSNTSLRSVFRSLSAGIIANLRSMSPPPEQLVGLRQIIGSGGSLARNSVMRKAVTNLYNLPLVINGKSDTADSAVGAAVAAGRFL